MGIKQLYNDNLLKLPNEYKDVSVMKYSKLYIGYRGESAVYKLIENVLEEQKEIKKNN